MNAISVGMVKTLRDRTGAGMMDCKHALNECEGNMETAIDWLRQKGHARMAKKTDRVAREGLVALAVQGRHGALIELASETDFVARNELFNQAAVRFSQIALEVGAEGLEKKINDEVQDLAVKLGENVSLKRVAVLEAPEGGMIASYLHNKQGEHTGKIGVLVAFAKGNEALGHKIAMHISAARPLAVRKENIDPALLARERDVLVAQAKEEGKPDTVVEKMVAGRLRKFYSEVALIEQDFVLDEEQTIGALLASENAELKGFSYFVLGEG